MYIDTTTNEWGLTPTDIMQRHPMTIFPEPFAPLEQYALVTEQPQPAYDADTHKLVEAAPELVDDEWLQRWVEVELTAEEISQRAAAQAAAEQAARDAARITISRTQGLVFIWRTLRVTEADIEAMIASMEDEDDKYEAGLYFRAATWDSDNAHVLMFGAGIGLDTQAKLEDAFRAAKAI